MIHIHGQTQEHDDIRIVGSREDLETLAALLLAASRRGLERPFFAADGEGFNVHVTEAEPTCDDLPYIRDYR